MFLIGHGTEEEQQRLKEAGYDLIQPPDGRFTITAPEGEGVLIAVFLDGDVTDLLIPPLCPYCGHFMGDPEMYYEGGAHVLLYRCESCGAEERHVRYPPNEEEERT